MTEIGRIRKVGIGIESTFGTKASTIVYVPYLDFEVNPKQERVDDTSAIGRIETPLANALVRKWSEPSISLIAYDGVIGSLLKAIFGALATTGPTDSAYSHALSVKNDNTPVSLTIVFKDGTQTRMITGCVVNTVDFQFVQNDFVKIEASFIGKFPADTTETPSYTIGNRFDGTMGTIKLASTIAGLSGASAVSIQELTLKIDKKASADKFFPIGGTEPTAIANGAFEVSGNIKKVFGATTYRDLVEAKTNQAISIAFTNSAVTIGSATNPSLSFILAPSKIENWVEDFGLDDLQTESFDFVGQYSTSDSKMISATLVNATTSY